MWFMIGSRQSRVASYTDLHRREVKCNIDDNVFLKVSSMRGVTRFDIKTKLALRYAGPFEIIEKVGDIAYCLELPPQLGMLMMFFTCLCSKGTLLTRHMSYYMQRFYYSHMWLIKNNLQRFWLERFACSITKRLQRSRYFGRDIVKKRPPGS